MSNEPPILPYTTAGRFNKVAGGSPIRGTLCIPLALGLREKKASPYKDLKNIFIVYIHYSTSYKLISKK
jgi:hypothetical protein